MPGNDCCHARIIAITPPRRPSRCCSTDLQRGDGQERIQMPLWLDPQPLVLASKSDVRGKILAAAGLRFGIPPAQIDERAVEAAANVGDAQAVARVLARAKAQAVASGSPGHVVLGA